MKDDLLATVKWGKKETSRRSSKNRDARQLEMAPRRAIGGVVALPYNAPNLTPRLLENVRKGF